MPLPRPTAAPDRVAPTHRVVQLREVGPLVVTWYEDGSVWAYGNPPLRDLVRLDAFAGALRLKGFARCCDRIDACLTQPALEALARELVEAHGTSPYAPYIRQWTAHRAAMLARGILHQPPGWGSGGGMTPIGGGRP